MVAPARVRQLNASAQKTAQGPVLYWMGRDQRVRDNWALLYAQELAIQAHQPLLVAFCVTNFLNAPWRHYDFMLRGLQTVASDLEQLQIPFLLVTENPVEPLATLVTQQNISAVITDFSPLTIGRQWRQELAKEIAVPLYEVDAHNIVPVWTASKKQEFGAYTLRPKLHKLLPQYLTNIPAVQPHPFAWAKAVPTIEWARVIDILKIDRSVSAITWREPGEYAAKEALRSFLQDRLENYDTDRNLPDHNGQSDLSPYLHYGQLSAQRIALEVQKLVGRDITELVRERENGSAQGENAAAFLEELIVRRELSDNFCYYNQQYNSFEGFPNWAQQTLTEHSADKRPYLYSLEELETAKTHDDLWNAAQTEMVVRGKMHGYLRMYWAKKILEWTPHPEEALHIGTYLNDKYELDGRDPNGYAGLAWAIGGVHDRPWVERPIFGKIRYMNYNGCKRKFDIAAYIAKVNSSAD